jgi:hypothetical protein
MNAIADMEEIFGRALITNDAVEPTAIAAIAASMEYAKQRMSMRLGDARYSALCGRSGAPAAVDARSA